MEDPFEMVRRLPSHQQRLAAEKKVNCYFIPGVSESTGRKHYAYVVCSAMLHDMFMSSLKLGAIPDYAVVVQVGDDEPTDAVKDKIREYYGFDHDGAEEA